MPIRAFCLKRLFLILCFALWSGLAAAQTAADGVFAGAKALYEAAQSKPPTDRIEDYRGVRRLLDLIVEQYPSSDLAVSILLQDTIEGLDVAAVDTALASAPQTPEAMAKAPGATAPQASVPDPAAEPATEREGSIPVFTFAPNAPPAVPRPKKEIIADLQEELNRLGCGAGSADGVAGRKTQAAFARFVDIAGAPLSPEALNTEAAVEAVRAEPNPVCTARWVIQNAPAKLAGNWGYRADCRVLFRKVRITGSMTMRQTGSGQFGGTAQNSLGERGPIYASITGNSVQTRIDFPRSKINSSLVTSRRSMSLSGQDSNGCEIVAWKN